MNIYGLLGKNIGYSFSRNYFSKRFEKDNAACEYQNFDIPSIEELPSVLAAQDIKGMNVTIPYKQAVIPYLDTLDPVAAEIGAVNVVKFDTNNRLIGYNSDYYGFSESLKPLLTDGVKKALILGTGGASKAIAYALDQLGIAYQYVSRTPAAHQISYEALDAAMIESHQLIINCTPLGTHPNIAQCPPIAYDHLTADHILYDLIYNPEETTFMKHGKAQGATVINGLQMLILQAEKSWEIWNE